MSVERERCSGCGLPLAGEDAERLQQVVERLVEVTEQQRMLAMEAADLRRRHAELVRDLRSGEAGGESEKMRLGPEWRPEIVRDVLLWLGSALVAIAALIFALVAWRRLGDVGRAGLLLGFTVLAGAGAAASRRRLPATAEALGGLTLALVLVDWYVVRRAGVWPGSSLGTWWSLGTGLTAALSAVTSRWLRLQGPAAAVLVLVSAVLAVGTAADGWVAAFGLALVAVPVATAAGRLAHHRVWIPTAVVLAGGAALVELALVGYLADTFDLGDSATAARAAGLLCLMALAPAGARTTVPGRGGGGLPQALVTLAALFLLGACTALFAIVWSSTTTLLAAVAVLGTAGIALAQVLPAAVRLGGVYAGAAAVGLGVLGLLEAALEAAADPLSWIGGPWGTTLTADALEHLTPTLPGPDLAYAAGAVALAALAGAAALAVAPLRGERLVTPVTASVTGMGAVVGVAASVPLAGRWPVWAAELVTGGVALAGMGAAAAADRRGLFQVGLALAGGAAVLGATATGWALATEAGTVAFLPVVAAAAAVAVGAAASAPIRQGLGAVSAAALVFESGAVALSAGLATAETGVVAALVGGCVLAAGSLGLAGRPEGVAVEAAGGAGLVVGAVLAGTEEPWLAVVLTLAVPCLGAAAIRRDRRAYGWAAAGVAVTATWAWLAFADVALLEAYTLPAAAVALAAGAAARRQAPALSSWPSSGPGLFVGLVPSLGLAVAEGGLTRPLILSGAALLVVLAGARTRLQAPLVLGGAVLVTLGVDALWPVVREVPRWTSLAAIGLLLLWLGATAERRTAQLREVGRRFAELEPTGPWGPNDEDR